MSIRVLNLELHPYLVVQTEALLYHRSFLLWSLGLKSTAREAEGVGSMCGSGRAQVLP